MTHREIFEWFEKEKEKNTPIYIPEEIFNQITEEIATELVRRFSRDTLLYLPEREIHFFEWLKEKDYDVWEDLWGGVKEEPYVVSISFLPLLIRRFGGFPICDLMNNVNYYFTEEMINPKTSHLLLETLREKYLQNEKLTIAQALLLEMSVAPIDIWHFAYYHQIPISEAKKAVEELVEDNLIVHYKTAEELANFVQF
ncbi:MAG: hypothetical protein CH6_3603 [Candidatus Kapaibacterium sp.]|nr:MAG: hypothetical protein CH6_3603 [Candidatus Kapabacteria bacterium]